MTRMTATTTAIAAALALFAMQSAQPAAAQSFSRETGLQASVQSAASAPSATDPASYPRARDGGIIVPVPAPATIVRDPALADVAAQAAALKPGESKWLDRTPHEGPMLVVVDLSAQRATVYRGGRPVAISTVSTGSAGRETPTGTYPILGKEKMHRSNLYNDAPMPFMQRLTWHGVALHAGHIPGYPASHGCVRLPRAFAEQLFGVTRSGNLVVIADDASPGSLMRAGLQQWMALQVGVLSHGEDASMLASEGGASAAMALGAP
jgi:lipoprotein-anchoring transpeptidase ErfK/SrfK